MLNNLLSFKVILSSVISMSNATCYTFILLSSALVKKKNFKAYQPSGMRMYYIEFFINIYIYYCSYMH